jgi:hypothetical protein
MQSCPVMTTLAERPTSMLPRQTVRPGVTALQEETVRPLSFAQERMWLLDQIDPGAAACKLYEAYHLFLAAFRDAAERLRASDRTARFPQGSFPPALPFVGALAPLGAPG